MRRHFSAWRASQGMTLVELMVGLAVGSMVLVAVAGIVVSQNKSFNEGRRLRERQSSARFALDYLERTVRQTGFGVDPQFAFDLDFYRCQTPAGGDLPYATDACKAGNPIRDQGSGPDELVTMMRSPSYQVGDAIGPGTVLGDAWVITTAASDSLTLEMREGDVLPMGQVLHLLCPQGSIYTYVTVGQSVTVGSTGQQTVSLATGDSTPFRQNTAAAAGCLSAGTAIAYRVNRSHFFIFSDTNANLPADAQNPSGLPRSYLVLDTGTDRNLNGTIDEADLIPVAPDIIDLQIAYVLNNDEVWGDDPAEAELTAILAQAPLQAQWDALGEMPITRPFPASLQDAQPFGRFDSPCLFDTLTNHPFRQLSYPGNIRAVRISLVARTSTPMPEGPATIELPPGPGNWLENREGFMMDAAPANYQPFLPAVGLRERYGYEVVQTTVNVPNLLMSGHFMF